MDSAFWDRVATQGDCWVWTGPLSDKGYASVVRSGRAQRVHRYAYELMVADVPAGLTLDHLCSVRHCVNPYHLDPVPASVNSRRAMAHKMAQSHCVNGHPYNEANTYERRGRRECRACNRERMRRQGKGKWTWSKYETH